MTRASQVEAGHASNAQFLRIGLEVFPVYGDEASGFTVFSGDLAPDTPARFRYESLEELFFALVNLQLATEGSA